MKRSNFGSVAVLFMTGACWSDDLYPVNLSADSGIGRERDRDGDGVVNENDCAPDDPEIFPGASDFKRDGVDQNCDSCDGLNCADAGIASSHIDAGSLPPVDNCDGERVVWEESGRTVLAFSFCQLQHGEQATRVCFSGSGSAWATDIQRLACIAPVNGVVRLNPAALGNDPITNVPRFRFGWNRFSFLLIDDLAIITPENQAPRWSKWASPLWAPRESWMYDNCDDADNLNGLASVFAATRADDGRLSPATTVERNQCPPRD